MTAISKNAGRVTAFAVSYFGFAVPLCAADYVDLIDRVRVKAEQTVVYSQSNTFSVPLKILHKGEIVRFYSGFLDGEWAHADDGYVRSVDIEPARASESLVRSTPFGNISLKIKHGEKFFDSNAAVFFEEKMVSTSDNYSELGELWPLKTGTVFLAGGHAGNSGEWCSIYFVSKDAHKELGKLNSCYGIKATTDPENDLIVFSPVDDDDKIDREIATVEKGVLKRTTIKARQADPNARRPRAGQDVDRWVGKSPVNVLHDDGEILRFSNIMSADELKMLENVSKVVSPCKLLSGYLFCESYGKASGVDYAIAVSRSNGDPFAIILRDGKVEHVYGGSLLPIVRIDEKTLRLPGSLNDAPPPILDWLHQKNAYGHANIPYNDTGSAAHDRFVVELSGVLRPPSSIGATKSVRDLYLDIAKVLHADAGDRGKGEFESTAEYKNRRQAAMDSGGYSQGHELAVKIDFSDMIGLGKYDADAEEYSFFGFGYDREKRRNTIDGNLNRTSVSEYVGENAFGRSAMVERNKYEQYNLVLNGPRLRLPKLHIKRAEAKRLIGDLRLMLVVQLIEPFVETGFFHQKPTIDRPVETETDSFSIVARPVRLLMYRDSDGSVLMELAASPSSSN